MVDMDCKLDKLSSHMLDNPLGNVHEEDSRWHYLRWTDTSQLWVAPFQGLKDQNDQ